ncbi:DNA transformation protein [Photobacterium jeanii]|uniref:DNA transformation protein n=2 Tax=Vibrionaceae TaxID=641 RepID=A0A178KLX1_9GAMM|nr:TfoX/Sxy family DNA transformation protein [Photobacterium jeanii]OAN18339.1 DNA transformation protein [Photobacterium jeanii]PST91979.1 DNA transformation protein [Photobacterium jeanii]
MSFKEEFFTYLSGFGEYEKRSMFGGMGVFIDGAMYAIITNKALFLRGGEALDERLHDLNCAKFKHIKRSTTAIVNYYDITPLFHESRELSDELVHASIDIARKDKVAKAAEKNKRIRDLPNMRLTLERMVKKAGVEDVASFMELGASEVFCKVRQVHGQDLDIKLLWMFAGAIQGCHWTLLNEEQKSSLLSAIS